MSGETFTSVDSSDLLLVKFDSAGTIEWSHTFSNNFNDVGKSVRQTFDGGFIVVGYSSNNVTDYASNIYLIKTDSLGNVDSTFTNVFNHQTPDEQIKMYPNPTSNNFTLRNISEKENTLMEIVNVFGENVYSKLLFGKNEYVIDANFTKGIYFVRVSDEEKNVVQKLIVE